MWIMLALAAPITARRNGRTFAAAAAIDRFIAEGGDEPYPDEE